MTTTVVAPETTRSPLSRVVFLCPSGESPNQGWVVTERSFGCLEVPIRGVFRFVFSTGGWTSGCSNPETVGLKQICKI